MSNNSWNSNICVKLCSRYSWLPLCLITSLINQSIYLCCFFKRISGYTQREWILCTDINKNKSRWKSIDTYIYLCTHWAICVVFLIILSVKERSFCLFYPLKSIISLSCLLLRTSIITIIERKRSRNHVV